MRIHKFKALLIFIGVASIAAFGVVIILKGDAPVAGAWRYKLTVTVDTPEGTKSNSAVRQVNWKLKPRSGNSPRFTVKVTGEAVTVDLGARGVLFALLDTDDYRWVFSNFRGPPGLTSEGLTYYTNLKGVKAILNPRQYPGYPKLVTFTDAADPLSIELVMKWKSKKTPPYPQSYLLEEDNFEKLFGVGVKLKEITIEMTDEPVTESVLQKLPWLPEYFNRRLDGERFGTIKAENVFANSLSAGAFLAR